jgi:hypothetical protein
MIVFINKTILLVYIIQLKELFIFTNKSENLFFYLFLKRV